LSEDTVPALPHGVRLKFDDKRDQWVLLAPERMLKLDPVAAEILKLVDGARTIETMVDDLSSRFETERDQVSSDVRAFLAQLAAKRMLEA
jgi:coenzyme PQQ biosynthesis protein PqqD